MRINILLCDTFPGLLPDYIPSYESMFMRLFDSVCEGVQYEVTPTWRGELPAYTDAGTLYLITGSNSDSFDETSPWIVSLRQWIRAAAAKNLRMAGICFGHQIIAHALGGKAARSPKGWGTGIRVSDVQDEALSEALGSSELKLLYNHHDQIVELSEGATPLATSDFCEYDAYRIGGNILAFQGHPEYIPEYAIHLIKNHAADEPEPTKARALESISRHEHDGRKVAKFIIDTLCK